MTSFNLNSKGTDPVDIRKLFQQLQNKLMSSLSSFTAGYLVKANSLGGLVSATNTDTDVADAVTKKHTRLHALSSVSDHSGQLIVTPVKNQILMYNGTNFVNVASGTSFTFSIASFTCTGGTTTVEMGVAGSTWIAAGAISFSASYNNGPATGSYISKSGWSNLTLTGVGFVGPTVSGEAVLYPAAVAGTKVFTLNATDGTDPTTSTITYYFYNKRFWGVTTKASGYLESDVEGLAGSELSNSKAKTVTIAPGVTEYILYAYPSRLGTATFWVGGFEGGFQSPESVVVVNSSGFSETYYVYRSTNLNLGSTEVTVV